MRIIMIIVIALFCLNLSTFAYNIRRGDKIRIELIIVKFKGDDIFINGKKLENTRDYNLSKMVENFIDKVGPENILNVEHNVTSSILTVLIVYKLPIS
ncbi:hypothetical protein CR532_04505 (plasmid) [Candidatus Borreliella tachyglossi]|uniref:Uncharacterized protein n=1 Tax=Candidatus Borreliella tachyglossi TaxID=1964448 RepID=A0A2S1LYC1_9SPIR|nr:hypothetical protein [Candidatus Borreliella tachyglossi]AWG43261.1 hypothetical protein CR532_04505 [Candidatus Borreliella tachyglossi]